MNLEIGKIYRFKDEIDRKNFSFGYTKGRFIGYSKNEWPMFILNENRNTQCAINATDENFMEAEVKG
jgi:hypothetical protein